MAAMMALPPHAVASFPMVVYRNVHNAQEIRAKLLQVQADTAPSSSSGVAPRRLAIVDLSLVVSAFHVQVAAYKAALHEQQGRMKAKASVAAELLYQVSPSTKITESVESMGVQTTSQELAFIYIPLAAAPSSSSSASSSASASSAPAADPPPPLSVDDLRTHITAVFAVQGEEIDPSELSTPALLTPEKHARVFKAFKLSGTELDTVTLEEAVITRLAVKDFS